MKRKVGVIGVGQMGLPMARNLVRSGFLVHVYDIKKQALEAAAQFGAKVCSSPGEVVKTSKVIISILPDSSALMEAVFGENGIFESIAENQILMEMSTLDLETILQLENQLNQKKALLVDAPVIGTPDRAESRDVTILASGKEELVNDSIDVLNALAKKVEYVGKTGNGKLLKLTNNLLVAVHKISTVEAMSFSIKNGIEPEIVLRIVGEASGNSEMFRRFGRVVVGENPAAAMKHSWHSKDLGLVLEECNKGQLSLPLAELSYQIVKAAADESKDGENFESLVNYYKKLMKMN